MSDEAKNPSDAGTVDHKWNDAMDAAIAETSSSDGPRGKKSTSALRVLVPVLAVLVVILAVTQSNRNRLAALEGEHVTQGAATKLLLTAGAIEDYVRKTGVLPDSLGDVRIDRMGVEYIKKGSDAYELRADAGGKTLVYRSDHRFVEGL